MRTRTISYPLLLACLLLALLGAARARPAADAQGEPPRMLLPLVQVTTPPLPIVLVHGWQGANLGMPCGRLTTAEARATWQHLGDYLGAGFTVVEPSVGGDAVTHPGLGYHVEYARLYSGGAIGADGPGDPSWRCTPPAEENVPYLMQAIDAARAATGRSQVILIAHSMGGLVSRAYLEGPHYRGDVRTLVTLGTPHVGVPVDVLMEWVTFITLGALTLDDYCLAQPFICQLADDESDPDFPPGYSGIATFNAAHAQRAPGVDYHLLGGDAGFFDRGWFGALIDAIIVGPDDGIVPLPSALGQSSQDGRLPPLSGALDRQFLYPTLHIETFTDDPDCLVDSPQRRYTFKGQDEWVDSCIFGDYVQRYLPPAAFTDCLAPLLADPTFVCGAVDDLADGPVRSGALLTPQPGATGRLSPTAPTVLTVDHRGGPLLLAARAGGPLQVVVRDPAGRQISPDTPEYRYYADELGLVLWLDDPPAGAWTIQLRAEAPLRYVLRVAVETE